MDLSKHPTDASVRADDVVDNGRLSDLPEQEDAIRTLSAYVDAAHAAIEDLRARFVETDGSSNDVAQMLDDWLVANGYPTVLYA